MRPPAIQSTSMMSEPRLHRAFEICAEKTLRNLPDLLASERSWAFAPDGDFAKWNEGFFEIGNWTPSFFTGMGLLAWLRTGDRAFLDRIEAMEPLYRRKIGEGAADTMHDLGFLYSLHAVALSKLTGEERWRELGLKAAEVLADRFIEPGDYIRAWGRMDETGPDVESEGLAIIDCMMNLPLLYWASEVGGDGRFRDYAIRHSDTTLKHFIRGDGSVYHSFRFGPDGSPAGGDNYCGRSIESHWARGAAWAMYGFALGYRHTGDMRYLDASLLVTRRWIAELDGEIVPVWDFRLGEGEEKLRDSSAAAITVCAIQELEALGHADEKIRSTKDALLARLCSRDYLDESPDIRGVLRQGQVGDGAGKARSAYTSWGDYFFMEGLARELGLKVTWW